MTSKKIVPVCSSAAPVEFARRHIVSEQDRAYETVLPEVGNRIGEEKAMAKDKGDQFLPTRNTLIERLQEPPNSLVWDRAWSDFHEIYWRVIYSYAKRMGVRQTDLADIVQEVLCKIQRALLTFKYDPSKGRFLHWVDRITWTTVADYFRRQKRRQEVLGVDLERDQDDNWLERLRDPEPPFDPSQFDEPITGAVYAGALVRARKRRKSVVFRAFELHFLEEVSVSQVASRLSITANQVSVYTNRVLKDIVEEGYRIRCDLDMRGFQL